jgi:hypothetical protein
MLFMLSRARRAAPRGRSRRELDERTPAGGSPILQGDTRVTIFVHLDHGRIMDLHAKEVGVVLNVAPHFIVNTRHYDLVFLEMSAAPEFTKCSTCFNLQCAR